jgi:hypothetical protein
LISAPSPLVAIPDVPVFLKLLFLGLICLSPPSNPLLVMEEAITDPGRFGTLPGGGIAIDAVEVARDRPTRAPVDGLRDMVI